MTDESTGGKNASGGPTANADPVKPLKLDDEWLIAAHLIDWMGALDESHHPIHPDRVRGVATRLLKALGNPNRAQETVQILSELSLFPEVVFEFLESLKAEKLDAKPGGQ